MEVISQLVFAVFTAEIVFFCFHWALHHKSIYQHVHVVHHEWTSPIAWEALYSQPLENIVSKLVSLGLGPLILGPEYNPW